MNKHVKLLAAAALVLCLSTAALAQEMPGAATPFATQAVQPMNSPPFIVASFGNPRTDPRVINALAALNTGLSRYDTLICGMLNHTQEIDFAAATKHGDWFSMVPLNEENIHGYQAYLTQRLHLNPDQEREAARIEDHLLADITPLYTAYQDSLNQVIAERRSMVSHALDSYPQGSVATPPIEEMPYHRVEVKGTKPPMPKEFIRNRDKK